MRQFTLAVVFSIALCCTALSAKTYDDDGRNTKPRTSAAEMGTIGLIAASGIGTGIYLVRRRGKTRT